MKGFPWLALVCALPSVSAAGTPPAPATADQANEGRLVTRHDGKTIDVPLEHTDVQIRVDGPLADATITQRFRNPYTTKIEAVYLFPLPTGAAVTEMRIQAGTRTITGAIRERGQARQIYEEARDKGFVAALLTQERPNLFTQAVANLEPAAAIEVTLHYVQRLDFEAGGYELVFPMVAGPRYTPPSAAKPAVQPAVLPPGLRSSHDISLRVTLDAGVAITGLASPSHQIEVTRDGRRATVSLSPGDTVPNKDFILRYQVGGAAPEFGALAYRDGGTGSFLLVAQPPAQAAPAAIAPRELVFLLDTSSSMRGAPLDQAKRLIARMLRSLRPDDTFQIVRFDDRASALGPLPIANKPKNVALTLAWLAALPAGGATEMVTGIDAALAVPHDPARLRIIAFLTDGYVGNEDQILTRVGARIGDARLFCFGVGSAVNRYLLEELAALGRGAAAVVRPDEDTAAAVAAFGRRIDAPVLTDVRIDWGDLAVRDVPRALPDLFLGQPLVVAGRYDRATAGTAAIHGKLGGRDVRFDVPVTLPAQDAARPAIASVWARQRIAALSRALVRKADPALEHEILALALEHHLLSPYTAFVAVDDARVTAGGAAPQVVVPVEVPALVGAIAAGGSGGGSGGGGFGYGIGVGSGGSIDVGGSYGTIGHGAGYGTGVGYGTGPLRSSVRVAVPIVTLAQPIAYSGSLDKAILRRYLKRQLNAIRYCYERVLLARPKLTGTLTAHFTINATGHVVQSSAAGLGDAEVEACVAKVIGDIEFPAAPGGGVIVVNYPFTFVPSAGAPAPTPKALP
jgi:Ca-activated chloride channel family protein